MISPLFFVFLRTVAQEKNPCSTTVRTYWPSDQDAIYKIHFQFIVKILIYSFLFYAIVVHS